MAEAREGGEVEVWGDGSAVRSYTYVADLVQGVCALMLSDLEGAANIGSPEYVTVGQLFDVVMEASGKFVTPRYVPGPVGVQSRNFSHERIESLGWSAPTSLKEGIGHTYRWVEEREREMRGGTHSVSA